MNKQIANHKSAQVLFGVSDIARVVIFRLFSFTSYVNHVLTARIGIALAAIRRRRHRALKVLTILGLNLWEMLANVNIYMNSCLQANASYRVFTRICCWQVVIVYWIISPRQGRHEANIYFRTIIYRCMLHKTPLLMLHACFHTFNAVSINQAARGHIWHGSCIPSTWPLLMLVLQTRLLNRCQMW